MATVANDMRAFGVVVGASVNSHASGIVAIGGTIQSINVTGAVVFGHSLTTSATAHYAQDSGGGGWAPGVIGFALAAQASGTGTINALIKPYPLFYTAAQVITQKYSAVDVAAAGGTIITNVVNVTPNQLLLFFGYNANTFTVPLWNALTPTQVQAASATVSYIGYLLGSGAATANWTGNWYNNTAGAVALALNGINQSTAFGTWANQNGTTGTAVNITVTCNPGDLVICALCARGTSLTFSGRNQTLVITQLGTGNAVDVQSAVATGNSVNFTWTIGGTPSHWSADGVAIKSA
jgi:hypothetical protein